MMDKILLRELIDDLDDVMARSDGFVSTETIGMILNVRVHLRLELASKK